jgi:uroporphyrinogen-III synthase
MVLRKQGIAPTLTVPAPHTTAALLEAVDVLDLRDRGVALLHYGEHNRQLAEGLLERGSWVAEFCLYEWLVPDDLTPLQDLVRDIVADRVDAIAFTNQVQARHL